jgi:very-short-patch-repair endonuclease
MRHRIFRSVWESHFGKCDSPIESQFLAAFCQAAREHGYEIGRRPKSMMTIGIQSQYQIDQIRVDFLLSYVMPSNIIEIVVECDGHDFHERTKEQAAKDRSRDRALQAAGYTVFRFTGSEIYADARGCAVEVLDLIMDFQTQSILDHFKNTKAA